MWHQSRFLPNRSSFHDGNLFSIYVGNLNWKASASAIKRVFKQFGFVHDVHIPAKARTRSSSLYAFVRFGHSGEAHRALSSLDGKVVLGRRLILRKARPRSGKQGSMMEFLPTKCSSFGHNESSLSNVPHKLLYDPAAWFVVPHIPSSKANNTWSLSSLGPDLFLGDFMEVSGSSEHNSSSMFEQMLYNSCSTAQDCMEAMSLFDIEPSFSAKLSQPGSEFELCPLSQDFSMARHAYTKAVEVQMLSPDADHSPPMEPLLLEWTAEEWNSAAELQPITSVKPKPNGSIAAHRPIPVKRVFDRIFKDLNWDTSCPTINSDICHGPRTNFADVPNPVEVYMSEDCFSDYSGSYSFLDRKAKLKAKIVERINRSRNMNSFKGRSCRKKKKRLKLLSLLYDAPIPKGRPSKKLIADSSISDSGFAKRNNQFLRDHGKGSEGLPTPSGEVLDCAACGVDTDNSPSLQPVHALSVEDEANMALDYGRRLGLVPIVDEESALEGLRETISRRRREWLAMQKE